MPGSVTAMPIYEYYCPANNTIYQFYAKTLAQGRTVPRCPDEPRASMVKLLSPFAVARRPKADAAAGAPNPSGDPAGDARMEAAMTAMESEFSRVDENDPRAMGRMMRRMADLTGEKMDGTMEEVVRKLEEGADPDALEAQLGAPEELAAESPAGGAPDARREARHRFRARRLSPIRDPKLYDYE